MKLRPSDPDCRLIAYIPENKTSDGAVVIFPGGAYAFLADHEGAGYAEFLAGHGVTSFVCLYRVAPHRFPDPLLDARRAVRLVRANASAFGVDPAKIAVMGSSAGGSLASILSTFNDPLPGERLDETDLLSARPDLQILCYPVVSLVDDAVTHAESRENLLGSDRASFAALSPDLHVSSATPPAFIWHTADDPGVPAKNSILYADALNSSGAEVELHIFPHGSHGLGLAYDDPAVGVWRDLLLAFLDRKFS